MLRLQDFIEIQKLDHEGVSVSEIAQRLDLDRKTVRKYLRQAQRDYETKPSMRKCFGSSVMTVALARNETEFRNFAALKAGAFQVSTLMTSSPPPRLHMQETSVHGQTADTVRIRLYVHTGVHACVRGAISTEHSAQITCGSTYRSDSQFNQ